MNNSIENNNVVSQNKIDGTPIWNGCTLEELKRRRIVALVRRELGREKLGSNMANIKSSVSSNGLRGVFFSRNTISKLKTVDYLLLGWKIAKGLLLLRGRKKRRR